MIDARKAHRRRGSRLLYLRDAIIRAHGMCSGRYIQSDTEMRRRAANVLKDTIMKDPVMAGFLGYPSIEARRDILTGSGNLDGDIADRRSGADRRKHDEVPE